MKLPVTDLARSAVWYCRLLGLRPRYEFVEQDELRGVSLSHPSGFQVALRLREHCASRPDLDGFDVVAFAVDSVDGLRSLMATCDEHGIAHGELRDNGPFGTSFDVADPDGTVLRFIHDAPDGPAGFIGVAFTADGPAPYFTPRLEGPGFEGPGLEGPG